MNQKNVKFDLDKSKNWYLENINKRDCLLLASSRKIEKDN